MFRRYLLCLSVLTLVCLAMPAYAAEFQPLGYEAVSMGGAGVASSRGSYAAYYNPALLARQRHSVEVSVSLGVGVRETNLVDNMDTLNNIDVEGTMEDVSNLSFEDVSGFTVGDEVSVTVDDPQLRENMATIKRVLRSLADKNGLGLMPNAVLAAQVGNFGIGAYVMGEATAFAVIDDNRLDAIVPVEQGGNTYYIEYDETASSFYLVDQADYYDRSLDYAVGDNESTYVVLSGLAYMEVPVAYGMTIGVVPGTFSLGGSAKIMSANTYSGIMKIDDESNDIVDTLQDSEESDSTIGFDLGALYSPPGLSNLSLGIVAKNLNSPEFNMPGGGTITIDPQIRAGAAMNLLSDKLTVAFDMDLSANETYIEGYDAQFAGGGVSFHPTSWFSVRGGAMKNIKETDEGLILTAGLGFGAKWIQADIAGQMSTKKGEFDGNEIPRYTRVQLSLVSKW